MGLLSLRSASVEIRTRSLVRLVRRASHASSTSTISPISQSREVGSRSIVPRCRKRPCLREINQHLPLFLCFGSKCPIQSVLGVFAELFGLRHCQNGSVPPVLRSLGSMTEASLSKIAHPGLQCKIINRQLSVQVARLLEAASSFYSRPTATASPSPSASPPPIAAIQSGSAIWPSATPSWRQSMNDSGGLRTPCRS
jgi:hypothetical protein